MKVEKVDGFADFPQHTYCEQLEDSVLSVTEGSWRYCVKYAEPLETEFIDFIVAPCVMESIYCSLTNKCTFIKLGKV